MYEGRLDIDVLLVTVAALLLPLGVLVLVLVPATAAMTVSVLYNNSVHCSAVWSAAPGGGRLPSRC